MARSEAARERIRTAFTALSDAQPAAESEFVEETFEHYDEHALEVRRFVDASNA